MDNVKRDYYEAIGLPHNADPKQIEDACVRLADKYRPENNPDDPLAAKHFALIEEVYETLGVPAKRAAYDISLRSPPNVVDSSNAKTADGSTKTESDKQTVRGLIAGCFAGFIVGILAIIVGAALSATLLGAIIGIPMVIVGVLVMVGAPIFGAIYGRKAIKGPCPYCGSSVIGYPMNIGITCRACKKRIVLRDKRYYRVDDPSRRAAYEGTSSAAQEQATTSPLPDRNFALIAARAALKGHGAGVGIGAFVLAILVLWLWHGTGQPVKVEQPAITVPAAVVDPVDAELHKLCKQWVYYRDRILEKAGSDEAAAAEARVNFQAVNHLMNEYGEARIARVCSWMH